MPQPTSYTLTTLQDADEWVTSQKSYKFLEAPRLSLDAGELAGMDREFLYFGHHAMTA